MRRLARRLVARCLRLLLALLPARHHVLVSAWPPREGNGVEVVRALLEHYDGAVVWADAPDADFLASVGIDPAAVRRVRKNSLPGLWAFLTAELSFFTHGLYGCPRPVRRKPMVNLWHGDGPKTKVGATVPSTYVVSGSAVFGAYRAEHFGVPASDLVLTGMPRAVELFHPLDDATLALLGLDPAVPFVVWVPTYRQAAGSGLDGSWVDVAGGDDASLVVAAAPGLAQLQALGIRVVIKPHPLDVSSREAPGVLTLAQGDLDAAGATLYRLLARAAGLLTDYSSVWTEFLLLDRPVGFYAPDLEAYVAGRGLYPADAMDHLPGPLLDGPDTFARWGGAVVGGDPDGSRQRAATRERFGLVAERQPAQALLTELARRGVLRLRGR